jgi:multiple sugar transport system permease protein
MRAFDLIYNITKGGPGTATETLDMYAFYRGVLWSGEISYASAMSVVMLVITIVLMNLIWKVAKKWVTF